MGVTAVYFSPTGNTKRSVLMEDPSYPKVRKIFRKNHYPIITADIDDKGLELT